MSFRGSHLSIPVAAVLFSLAALAQQPTLLVDKAPFPLEAELTWTGGVPIHEIYRGTDAETLFSPANKLDESTANNYVLGFFGNPDLVFYQVRSTGGCDFTQTDAVLIEGNPNTPYGLLTVVQLADDPLAGGRQHSLLRFELSEIPQGATVTRATLAMQLNSWGGSQLDVDLRPATEPWSETLATWNNRPSTGPSAGVVSMASGAGWKELDVTALVQGWIDDPSQNFGVSLEPTAPTSIWAFDSGEASPGNLGPRLCVEWETPADQALGQLAAGSERPAEIDSRDGQMQFYTGRIRTGGSTTDPVIQALDHLYDFRDLYEFDDPQGELYLSRILTDGNRQDVVFQQRIENIPVYGAEVAVHLRDSYVEATSSYLLTPPLELPAVQKGPKPSQDLALAAAPGVDPVPIGEPVLMVFSLEPVTRIPSPTRLVWRVLVESLVDGVAETSEVMVAADDGQIVHLSGFDQTLGGTPDKNFDIISANQTVPRGFCYNLSLNTTKWYNENGQVNYSAPADPFSEGPPTFDNTHDTYDMYYDSFSRRSLNDNDNQVEVILRFGNNVRNAFWSGACKHMRFGDGYAVNDIYAHEYTHGVIDYTSNLVYRSEPGALNESLADVFGTFADFEFGDGDWLIGEDIPNALVTNPCSPTDGRFRNMADPPTCGHPDHVLAAVSGDGVGLQKTINPQCGTGGNDCGFVHSNSGITNKAAYLIVEGGVHNGFSMIGVGIPKVKQLYYDAMTERLRKNSQLFDMRNAAVDLARQYDRDGTFTPTDACTVINAFHSVGLGDPDEDCDGDPEPLGSLNDPDGDLLEGVNDNCPWVKNLSQSDLDGDGKGDECDEDRDGDGVDDRIDNCAEDVNPGQADGNNDGRGDACGDDDGDGIDNPQDNCPAVPNPLQRDNDGDGSGDKCDIDDDNDGLSDVSDPCPFDSTATSDTDGDGVGNACDNCEDVPNPDQSDIDYDGDGDECDVDRDNDGVININDNCPDVPNPDQVDSDENGFGLECDLPERGWFDGIEQLGDLIFFVQQKLDRPVSLPLLPCTDQCPDWLGPDTVTTVQLSTSPAMIPRIVDNYGNVVEAEVLEVSGDYMLKFKPAADFSYLSPARGAVPSTSPYALERIQARSYRLELFARPGSVEEPVQVIINVDTELVP